MKPVTLTAYINSLRVRMATDAECLRQYGISLQEWLRKWREEKRDGTERIRKHDR